MSREVLLEQFMYPERLARLDGVLRRRTSSLTVVLDGVHNHHNTSAVIRSADAFGLTSVHLVGDERVFTYRRGVTLGTERWIEIEHHENGTAAVEWLRREGFTIAVTAPAEDPRRPKDARVRVLPVYDLPFENKLAVVFGNEKSGVSDELLAAADIHAYIPMVGFVESLNISVATAITLFCSLIRGTAERRPPLLGDEEREELRKEWLVIGKKRGDRILRELEKRDEDES